MIMENKVNINFISFNFQLKSDLDIYGLHAKFKPIAVRYNFRENGAGTDLNTEVRDIGGSIKDEKTLIVMDLALRETFKETYLGYD